MGTTEGLMSLIRSPGMPFSGLTLTSKVAFEGNSAAVRTSIGPDTDASAFVSPEQGVYVQNVKTE